MKRCSDPQKRSKVIQLEYEAAPSATPTSAKAFRSYAEEMRYLGKGKLWCCTFHFLAALNSNPLSR